MKSFWPRLSVLPVLLLLFYCSSPVRTDEKIESFPQLSDLFMDPPACYRTVPFWVWNGEVTREMIDEQLEEFKARGIGGVFIHPRYGLLTEYLSPEWFDLTAYAMQKAKSLGMDLWIYDENSYPSGFAGGHVPDRMPESYNQGQGIRMVEQSVLLPDSSARYIHIFKKENDQLMDITSIAGSEAGSKGEFYLFELHNYPNGGWFGGYSYVDLLLPGVTERFIEVTMSGYEKAIGEEFGGSMPGVFTDEPNIAPPKGENMLRWTPDLFEQFEKRWGYDLRPNLFSLLDDTGDYRRIRHNYYGLLLELFIERWSKPWYEYTEEKGIAWTGHYWEHGWPSPHHGGDNMAMYAWHQVPAIDMLFNNWEGRADQFGNVRAVKELRSVANQMGRVRTLSETYGGSGWDLTFEDMKRNGDWEYVLGVNLMNQHLSFQTLMGDRKHDFPQSFSYQVPWWKEYRIQADYFARLSLAMSAGEQINDILVIEPTSTAWMYYSPGGDHTLLDDLESDFRSLVDELERLQVEYDLGCENIMKDHGSVSEGQMVIGERSYSSVVLPESLCNLDTPTRILIEKFLEEGGTLISLGKPPEYSDGNATDVMMSWPEDFPDQWISIDGISNAELDGLFSSKGLNFSGQTGADVLHHRRVLSDGQLLNIVNPDKKEYAKITFEMEGADVVQLDLFKGSIASFPFDTEAESVSFKVELPPVGSLLLFISNKRIKEKSVEAADWHGEKQILALGPLEIKPVSENVVTLDYCYLTMDDHQRKFQYFYDASQAIFKAHGFEKNPWVSAVQFKQQIIERDTFSDGSGFVAEFPFNLDSGMTGISLKLVVERPSLYSVYINSELVSPTEGEWWIDKSFRVFDITGKTIAGENLITLRADPMSVHCELEPVYLIGDFSLESVDHGWCISSPETLTTGSWKEQGYPFYSNAVDYSTSFTLKDADQPVKLRFGAWKGTVASVYVNGEKAGQIFTPPYELRLDGFLKEGINQVTIRVFGSLKNVFGPHHRIGKPGFVSPWSFQYADKEQPPGDAYHTLDYGLMEGIAIVVGK